MIPSWQLQEAKNNLNRVVENAENSGPQIITKHGIEVAVVLSLAEYQQLVASRGKLSAFCRESPLASVELELTRDRSMTRQDPILHSRVCRSPATDSLGSKDTEGQ